LKAPAVDPLRGLARVVQSMQRVRDAQREQVDSMRGWFLRAGRYPASSLCQSLRRQL
jgi:hypothetical protein